MPTNFRSSVKLKAAAIFLLLLQVAFIVIIGVFARYDETADAKSEDPLGNKGLLPMVRYYAKFQDVNVMIFIGFGFLMTFLKRYGFSSFGFNMLLSAFVIEWAAVLHGIAHMIESRKPYFYLHITSMFFGEFAAATILISFGAVLGKASIFQLLIMAVIEVVLQHINEYIILYVIQAVDIGGSMLVHAFGAYFGLALARVIHSEDISKSKKEGSTYQSDIFSFIGTIFLWVFWPSFNAALADGNFKHRAVINTFYAMAACTVATFIVSILVDKKAKIEAVYIQNATLAGGVAVGTSADLMIQPYGAMIIGVLAGVLSTIGYKYITPFLISKLKIHDTCGVNNLHGMPAILAGLAGAVAAAMANEYTYGKSLYVAFPARSPTENSPELAILSAQHGPLKPGYGRSALMQGGYQVLALVCTLGIAIVGGILTGLLLRIPIFSQPKGNNLFEDEENWNLPDSDETKEEAPVYSLQTKEELM